MRYQSLPQIIPDSEAQEIIRRFRNNATLADDRERLILGYMRFAANKARRVLKYQNEGQIDMCQVAYLALVETVDKIWKGEIIMYDDNFVKVASKNIEYRCRDYYAKRKIVSTNYNTLRYKLRTGINDSHNLLPEFEELDEKSKAILRLLPFKYQIEMIDIVPKVDIETLKKLVKNKIYKSLVPGNEQIDLEVSVETDNYKITEISHILNESIHNTTEYWIIEMRKEGYTYHEIGNRIKLSAMQVGYYVNQVKERFEKLYEDRLK